jgi:hypothetical protein
LRVQQDRGERLADFVGYRARQLAQVVTAARARGRPLPSRLRFGPPLPRTRDEEAADEPCLESSTASAAMMYQR